MPTIRPKDLPRVTAPTAGDALILDGATLRSIAIENLLVNATSINKVTITAPATGATFTLPDGVILTGPASSGTVMTLGNVETVTGAKTFNDGKLILAGSSSGTSVLKATAVASGTLTLPATTDTLVGKATTDILTNKTFDTAGTGNVFKINGTQITAIIGSGAVVLATSPTLTNPTITGASLTTSSLNGVTLGGNGQYPGETSTGSATAGNIGEEIVQNIVSGSGVALTTGTPANIATITLTAGDWDIEAQSCFSGGATTQVGGLRSSISTASATENTASPNFCGGSYGSITAFSQFDVGLSIARIRVSLSGSQQYWLVANAIFSVSTCKGYGKLRARRVR